MVANIPDLEPMTDVGWDFYINALLLRTAAGHDPVDTIVALHLIGTTDIIFVGILATLNRAAALVFLTVDYFELQLDFHVSKIRLFTVTATLKW